LCLIVTAAAAAAAAAAAVNISKFFNIKKSNAKQNKYHNYIMRNPIWIK